MDFQGRTNILVVPKTPDGSLIIALHGGTGAPASFQSQMMLVDTFVNSHILYAAADDDNNNVWRAGGIYGDGLEDYNYLSDLIDHMIFNYPIYASQVHTLGHSNGCMMNYRLVNKKTSFKFASVTGISGSFLAPEEFTFTGKIMHLHGTTDAIVPKNGDDKYKSVDEMMVVMEKTAQVEVGLIGGAKHNIEGIKSIYPKLNERIKLFMGL